MSERMDARLQRRIQRYTTVRERVQARYLGALSPWREGRGYRVPAEYLIVAAQRLEAGAGDAPGDR